MRASATSPPATCCFFNSKHPSRWSGHAARVASGAGATVVLNPTPVPDSVRDLFDDVDLLVVNEHELAHLADDIASLARKADATVICTLGADGVDVTHRGSVEHIAASAVDAVDTTAAGDTFIGYFAAHLAGAPDDILGAIRVAVLAAGVTVTRPGAIESIPFDDELASNAMRTEGRR